MFDSNENISRLVSSLLALRKMTATHKCLAVIKINPSVGEWSTRKHFKLI